MHYPVAQRLTASRPDVDLPIPGGSKQVTIMGTGTARITLTEHDDCAGPPFDVELSVFSLKLEQPWWSLDRVKVERVSADVDVFLLAK